MSEDTEHRPMAATEQQRSNYKPDFLKRLNTTSENGLSINNVYLPPEIVMLILTYLDGKDLLQTSLVCLTWFNMIRSNTFWCIKFKRRFGKKPKNVPWYVYYAYFNHGLFDRNLIKNGNGENRYQHWNVVRLTGSRCRIEVPAGTDALPTNIEDFNGHRSCFVMSEMPFMKWQKIEFAPLCRLILDTYKPHVYASEWIASKADCTYVVHCRLHGKDGQDEPPLAEDTKIVAVPEEEDREWSKVDMVISDYPEGVEKIIFEHVGRNFSAGCRLKMAGGVVKILFETVKEVSSKDEIE